MVVAITFVTEARSNTVATVIAVGLARLAMPAPVAPDGYWPEP